MKHSIEFEEQFLQAIETRCNVSTINSSTQLNQILNFLYREVTYNNLKISNDLLAKSFKQCFIYYADALQKECNQEIEEDMVKGIKSLFPSRYWADLIAYLPNVPKKQDSDNPLFQISSKQMVEVILSTQEVFNTYDKINTHEELDKSLELIVKMLNDSNFSEVSSVEIRPRINKEIIPLLISSEGIPPVKTVLILISDMLSTINEIEDRFNLLPHYDKLYKTLQKSWFELLLPVKGSTKKKKI